MVGLCTRGGGGRRLIVGGLRHTSHQSIHSTNNISKILTWVIAVHASFVPFDFSNSFLCIRNKRLSFFWFNISIRIGWFQGLEITTVDDFKEG